MSHSASVLGTTGRQVLLLLATVGLIGFGSYVGRTYRTLSGRYFAGFLVITSVTPVSDLLDQALAHAGIPPFLRVARVLLDPLSVTVGFVGGMCFWLAFVLSYTSAMDRRENRLLVGGTVTAVLLSVVLIVPGEFQEAGYLDVDAPVTIVRELAILFFVVLLGLGILGYGAIRLFRTAETSANFSRGGATLLTLAGSWWFVGEFTLNVVLGVHHAEAVGFGLLVTVGAVGAAVVGSDVLEDIPASRVVGRETAVDTIESAMVVIDPQGTVIDTNTATDQLFETPASEFVGRPVDEMLPETVDPSAIESPGQSVFEVESDSRVVRSHTATATDDSGRELGRVIVFHDITDERRRQQRIQVLNRVLRHNLRNDLNAVNGYAELLAEQREDPNEYLGQIQRTASELISTGEKAREIEEVVRTHRQSGSARLRDVVDRAIEQARTGLDDCEIEVSHARTDVEVDETVLRSVVRELIENACQHNDTEDPLVEVETRVDDGDYPVTIRVSDNGPGIPEHELTPLREGAETALEHGSGLGLWLVDWGVGELGGDVEFDVADGGGTVATLRLPTAG